MEQRLNCPSCGAPVAFKSAASVMAVCEFCHTAMLRDAQQVRDIGEASIALEDYSPIRIGMSGRWGSRPFDVIGRIQVRYERGLWNEWYVMFADAGTGWLSDAQGLYTITEAKPAVPKVVPFAQWRPGLGLSYDGASWVASDVRTGQAVGAEGELPFKLGEGWSAPVVDLRADKRFISLDWSDGDAPTLYEGAGVEFASLQAQLARSDDEIIEKAGRYRGKLDELKCPNCGGGIQYVAGLTPRLSCPSCNAQIDISPERTEVLRVLDRQDETAYTYALGSTAKIDAVDYTLIGAMTRASVGEGSEQWNEYLLYNPKAGFMWLAQTADEWQSGRVIEDWPKPQGGGIVELGAVRYSRTESYQARVERAVGAFNWRVEAGDVVQVNEFVAGVETLSAESDAHELGWTRLRRVDAATVAEWFGKAKTAASAVADEPSFFGVAIVATIALVLLNVIPVVAGGDNPFWFGLIALFAIWMPVKWFGSQSDRAKFAKSTKSSDDD